MQAKRFDAEPQHQRQVHGVCEQFVANAAVSGNQFRWHVDADPADVPPDSDWAASMGLYTNRVRPTPPQSTCQHAAHTLFPLSDLIRGAAAVLPLRSSTAATTPANQRWDIMTACYSPTPGSQTRNILIVLSDWANDPALLPTPASPARTAGAVVLDCIQ